MINAAKKVLEERGNNDVNSKETYATNADYYMLVNKAKNKIEEKVSIEVIKEELLQGGANEQDIDRAILEAAKVANLNKKPIEKEKGNGLGIWGIIFIIIFIVKIILRMARS